MIFVGKTNLDLIKTELKLCLVETTKHLQKMLPHNSKFLKYAQYITPSKKSKNGSLSAIGKLACTIGNVLKPSGICGSKTVEQWADYIKSQYQIYQSEEINLDENNIAIYWDSVGSMKDEQGNYRFMEVAYMIKSCL